MRHLKLLVLSLLCLIGLQGNMTQALGANYIAHGPTESIWDNPYLEYTLKPLTHGATQGAIGQAFGEDFNAGFNAAVASSLTGALTRDIGYELGLNKEQRKEAAEQLASNIGQATAGLSGADPNFGRQIGENVYEYNDTKADYESYIQDFESYIKTLEETESNNPETQAIINEYKENIQEIETKIAYIEEIAQLYQKGYEKRGISYEELITELDDSDPLWYIRLGINDAAKNLGGQAIIEAIADENYLATIKPIMIEVATSKAMSAIKLAKLAPELTNKLIDKLPLKTVDSFVDQGKFNPQFWNKTINFNGNKVFQRDDLFDPNFLDKKSGLTNLELMKKGRAPIGADGKPINLHHMTQQHEGAIAEVTQTFHQQNLKVIHINSSSTPSGINRAKFNKWRANYWKNRATGFE